MYTVKEIESEMEIKEYEIFEEQDAIDVADKEVKIKVKIDTATKESLERDKACLQSLMKIIDDKLKAVELFIKK